MFQFLLSLLTEAGVEKNTAALAAYLATLTVIVAASLLLRLVVKFAVVRVAERVVKRSKSAWADIFFKSSLFHRAANLSVPVTISLLAPSLPHYGGLLSKIAGVIAVVVFLQVFHSLANAANDIYRLYEVSKMRPIHSFVQVVQVVVMIVGGIVAVAILTGQNPFALLGGIGALTAVTSFIFKDAILGFVAGIQLTGNDMIRIGDWVEVPGQSADGTVVDLSMTTVKIENFNKTITSVPAYALVSGAFINWRGMEASGGRRIKRSIFIDTAGVRMCDDELLARLRHMDLLRDYIDSKIVEIEQFNCEQGIRADGVNGRQLTNLGTFRAYITRYLQQHPGIHKGMSLMVRQLDPDDRGIPLEIYAFANTTVWAQYEGIQSDIFDHLYAVIPAFGLRAYQRPSSSDIRSLTPRDK